MAEVSNDGRLEEHHDIALGSTGVDELRDKDKSEATLEEQDSVCSSTLTKRGGETRRTEEHLSRAKIADPSYNTPISTLEDLPDELLSLVLQYSVGVNLIVEQLAIRPQFWAKTNRISAYEASNNSLFSYALVCSRFWTIILNTPFIWAQIHLCCHMPPIFMETVARRGGDLGLIVFISECHLRRLEMQPRVDALSMLFKYSHRWINVWIHIEEKATAQHIQAHYSSADLASALKVIVNRHDDSWAPQFSFWQHWSIPNLQLLSCPLIISPSSRFGNNVTKLQDCTLDIGGIGDGLSPEVPEILTFLSTIPNITQLSLSIRYLEHSETITPLRHEVPLPLLEHLTIISKGQSAGTVDSLLLAISSPHLKVPRLDAQELTVAQYLEIAQRIREDYPILDTFEMNMRKRIWASNNAAINLVLMKLSFFADILCLLPSTIRHIKVDNVELRSEVDEHFNFLTYPLLEHLDVYDEPTGKKDGFLDHMFSVLRQCGAKLTRFDCYMRRRTSKKTTLLKRDSVNLQNGRVLESDWDLVHTVFVQ